MRTIAILTVAACLLALGAGKSHAKVTTLLSCKQGKLTAEAETLATGTESTRADLYHPLATGACGPSISRCGCTITEPGIYSVNAILMSSQGATGNGDCVDVKAQNVRLFLHGYSIIGKEAGTGIRLLTTADNAFVEGTASGNGTASAVITGWRIGIEVDSSNAIVEDFQAQSNGVAGVLLNEGNHNNINDFTASNNGVYGLWIRGANANQINCADTVQNTQIGVYLGCSPDGTLGSTCRGVLPSTGNRIYDHYSDDNGSAGIAIDIGDTGNFVTDTEASGNTGDDLSDQNRNCASNLWYLNNFANVNATCVH